jgi:hypothetical protein
VFTLAAGLLAVAVAGVGLAQGAQGAPGAQGAQTDAPGPEGQDWMPGEAIVRFAPASATGAAVRRALSGKLERDPGLTAALQALSERLHLPVRAQGLGAHGEVVVEVERPALEAKILASLRSDPRVEEVAGVDTSGESPFRDPWIEVRARLSAATEAGRTVAAAWAATDKSSPDLQALARSLTPGVDLPLRVEATGESELTLRAGLRELTDELLLRLRRDPEVESAEPNRVLHYQ